jgi:hypothetical protein
LRWKMEYTNSGPYGGVTAGCLSVRGFVLPVSPDIMRKRCYYINAYWKPYKFHSELLAISPYATRDGGIVKADSKSDILCTFDIFLASSSASHDIFEGASFLQVATWGRSWGGKTHEILALMLVPAGSGTYRRVGLASFCDVKGGLLDLGWKMKNVVVE